MERSCKTCELKDSKGCSSGSGGVFCSQWKKATPTLLDEFAIAAIACLTVPKGATTKAVAFDAYEIAAAMMAERARRDENGNIKESTRE